MGWVRVLRCLGRLKFGWPDADDLLSSDDELMTRTREDKRQEPFSTTAKGGPNGAVCRGEEGGSSTSTSGAPRRRRGSWGP